MFFECEMPRSIGLVPTGGDEFNTTVNPGIGGDEQRNKNWSRARRRFMLAFNGKDFEYYKLVRAFFLNVGGMADAFRMYWPLDSQATGETIGTGDGVITAFQLKKSYSVGSRSYSFTIKKPITADVETFDGTFLTNTVKVYDNGVLKTLTTDYTVDSTTGIVTFVTAPVTGHLITADCQFHIPVRFDTDSMASIQVLSPDLKIKWPNVQIIEVKL